MQISIFPSARELGMAAGKRAANAIREAIAQQGQANIILATGTSQFHTLETLVADTDIDWSLVTAFHLDEYIGIPDTHGASFRKYLRERFIEKVAPLANFHLINGEHDPTKECARLASLIADKNIDVALIGIGENGHLAFNDPPADFLTKQPYIIVELDMDCRKQQLGEGWFANIDEVPRHAISMSVHHILQSRYIICSVPDQRKAKAVHECLAGAIDPMHPASALLQHNHCDIMLDTSSASLLSADIIQKNLSA